MFDRVACGHTFCLNCLNDWFQVTLAAHQTANPSYNPETMIPTKWQEHARDNELSFAQRCMVIAQMDWTVGKTAHPRYTCPVCRIRTKSPPFIVAALKKVAALLGDDKNKRASLTHKHWEDLFPFNVRA